MNRPTFDVLKEPWIPVIDKEGVKREMGILDCLFQAHTLREIRDPSPLIEFGLYRLLIAFVLDALILSDQRPEDEQDLEELLASGAFDRDMLESYVEQCDDVFDLFHPARPFFQTPMEDSKPKPIAGMYPVAPSGTGVLHWLHASEEDIAMSVEAAVRLLTTIPPFMTSGGAGLSPSINGAPGIYVLPVGESLFETLVLNIPTREQEKGDGVSAWCSSRQPGSERNEATTIESLTWQPRRIQLIPEVVDGKILISRMKYEAGDKTRLDWIDGSLAYRYGPDKVSPVRMREGRPLWRDAGPLLFVKESRSRSADSKYAFQRPDVLDQTFAIVDRNKDITIKAYGMRTDMKMKVFEWTKAEWKVPAKLGYSTRLGSLVMAELNKAETISYALGNGIKALYPRGGAGNKNALNAISSRARRKYWSHLERHFNSLMHAFGALEPEAADDVEKIAETAKPWRTAIREIAIEQFEFAARDMDADSDALERQVKARSNLHTKIRKELS